MRKFTKYPQQNITAASENGKFSNPSRYRYGTFTEYDFSDTTQIDPNEFRDSALEYADLSNVTYIGSSAFRGSKLKDVVLNPNVNILSAAFADNKDLATTITVTPGMQLGLDCFQNCPQLTVIWEAEDRAYEFEGIRSLVFDFEACPKLYEANEGWVNMEHI